MLAEDWETGAKGHEEAYQAYKQGQETVGEPVAPIGKWYVTQVMMTTMFSVILTKVAAERPEEDTGSTAPKRHKTKDPSAVPAPDDDGDI